jgi:hypothetical protein
MTTWLPLDDALEVDDPELDAVLLVAPPVAVLAVAPPPVVLSELPLTDSPLVRVTEVTVPDIVARNAASDSAVRADAKDCLAAVTDASSAASWVEEALSSSINFSSAAASVDRAEARSSARAVAPTVASVWPSTTLSPAFTLTEVTRPLTVKSRSASDDGSIVPDAETVSLTSVSFAATSCVVADAADPPRVMA